MPRAVKYPVKLFVRITTEQSLGLKVLALKQQGLTIEDVEKVDLAPLVREALGNYLAENGAAVLAGATALTQAASEVSE